MEKSGFSRENDSNSFKRTSDSRTHLQHSMKDLKLTKDEQNKIGLTANYFPIEISARVIYHYDIDIHEVREGENNDGAARNRYTHEKYTLSTKIKRNVVETITTTMLEDIRPAFDGERNLYTSKPLPKILQETFNIIIDVNGRSVIYEINIIPVNIEYNAGSLSKNCISLEPLCQLLEGKYCYITEEIEIVIVAIDTIIRHGPAQHLIPIGKSFYQESNDEEKCQLSGGLEIWFGHHQSVQLTNRKLMLNIDRSAEPFYKNCSVIDFMLAILLYPGSTNKEQTLRQIQKLTTIQLDTLKRELKNVNIRVTLPKQHRKIIRISSITSSANETFFYKEVDGKTLKLSVSEYFQSEYKQLSYPNLPCLDVGTKYGIRYFPIEICEIETRQQYNRKLSEKQMKEMIQFTAQTPSERFQEIQNLLQVVLRDFDIFSREFGIRINPYPIRLTGRVLTPPIITYSEDRVKPCNGCWNMKGKRFLEGVNVEKWMILNFSSSKNCNKTTLENFARKLFNEGRKLGLGFSHSPIIKTVINCNHAPGNIIRKEKNTERNLQLIVVVLPTKEENSIYREIKTAAETELGIITQCVKNANISGKKCTPELISNICLKINAKMGGVNNSLLPEQHLEDIMTVGADCCHLSLGEDNQYSIAALVGNIDHISGRYKASVKVQKPDFAYRIKSGQEIINDMKEIMKEILIAYRAYNRDRKPKKLLFYRASVNEDDFQKLLHYETKQIRNAFYEVYGGSGNEVLITFIVVMKCHHTRFNIVRPSGDVGNVPIGTVVDTDIVHPIFMDFFLCSEMGIQGTSQPTYYTVIYDENCFSLDEIQSLTFSLCHTSARSTTSTAVPSSVTYADLAAARAKDYLICKNIKMSSFMCDARPQSCLEESIGEAIKVVENLENSMYFI